MRKLSLLLFVVFLIVLTGCAAKDPDAQAVKDGKVVPEVNIQRNATDEPIGEEPDPAADSARSDDALAVIDAMGITAIPAPKAEAQADDVIEITEKMFIAQCNDIYLNPDDYTGKTIRIEGMYNEVADTDGITYLSVIRNGPGCCGNDGVAGFEFTDADALDCQIGDWISVEGIVTPLVLFEGVETVVIGEAKVTVKTERGAEYVTQ